MVAVFLTVVLVLFGAIYSLIWMVYTKAAWIPVFALICVIGAAAPTTYKLIKYIKK